MDWTITTKELAKGFAVVRRWLPQEKAGYTPTVQVGADERGCFLGACIDGSSVRTYLWGDAISPGAVETRRHCLEKIIKGADTVRFCESTRDTALGRPIEYRTVYEHGGMSEWIAPAGRRIPLVSIPAPSLPLTLDCFHGLLESGFNRQFSIIPRWGREMQRWDSVRHGEDEWGRLVLGDGKIVVVLNTPHAPPKRRYTPVNTANLRPATIERQNCRALDGWMALWSGSVIAHKWHPIKKERR